MAASSSLSALPAFRPCPVLQSTGEVAPQTDEGQGEPSGVSRRVAQLGPTTRRLTPLGSPKFDSCAMSSVGKGF